MSKDAAKTQKDKKHFFNKKKIKYGAVATVITVVFIAFVVFINLIAGILTDRKGLKIDLTEEQYYEISQETIDYLSNITTDVEIAVTSKESSLETQTGKMVLETLNKFRQCSDHIKVNFYDVASNPEIVTKFSQNYNGEINAGSVVISANNKVKVKSILYDLFTVQSGYYGISTTGYKGEQELFSAIMSVTDANPKRAAFIKKYNSSIIYHSYNSGSIDTLYDLMNKNGYVITEVDLMTDTISPDDYDLAVLPAPVNDLTEGDIQKLEDFLYNGGNLDKDMVYIADIYQYATPNLNDFLEVWGVKIGNSYVIETDDSMCQYVTTINGSVKVPVALYADDTYSEGLSNTKLPVVMPNTRPVELLFESNVDRTVKPLLKSTDTAAQYPLEVMTVEEAQEMAEAAQKQNDDSSAGETEEQTEAATQFDVDTAERSSQTLMALATKSMTDSSNNIHENNVMVIGGTTILDELLTSSNTFNNAEYVINAINKMSGKENSIIIAPKSFSDHTIDIKSSQVKAISRVVIYIIPLIVVAAGIVVYIRRRNR